MKKIIALGLLLGSSLYVNAVPSITNGSNLKIFHCELEINRFGAPRYQDHVVYSGNLVINDILEKDQEIATTYLTLSPYSEYDYEARINFHRFQQSNEILGTIMLNKKGTVNIDNVANAEIIDSQSKQINYFDTDTGSMYNLKCYYRD